MSSKRKKELSNRDSNEKDKERDSASDLSAFVVEAYSNEIMNSTSRDIWFLDSGASKHMTFRHDWFSEIRTCDSKYVSLGDETSCKVKGHGTIHIKRLVNDKWLDGKLENVLYVPNLSKNLFSVGACINKDYKVTFRKKQVHMNNELKAQGMKQDNNLFRMLIKVECRNDGNLAVVSNLKRWHERLGHVNFRNIHQLCKEGLIGGSMKGNGSNKDTFCEACQYGKQHRLPFNSIAKRDSIRRNDSQRCVRTNVSRFNRRF